MTPQGRAATFRVWLVAVAAAGLAALAVAAVDDGRELLDQASPAFWTVAALVVATDLFYIRLPNRDETITVTSTFAVAMLLGWGIAAGMLISAVASGVSDLLHRRPPRKILFNVAQYGLSMGAAGIAWALLGGRTPFTTGQLPAFVAAALVYSVVNSLLVSITTALADGRSLATAMWDDAGFEAWTSAMLLGMAPVTVIIAERSALLLLLLLLPVGAVYLASRGALAAIAHRTEAEEQARAAAATAAEHARLAEAERQVVRQLQEHDRLKSDLLATVSHELRTPLTGILGSLKTLDARGDALTPEQRQDFLEMARQEGERLKGLIEQLLIASRFQTMPSEPAIRPLIDAAEVVRSAGEAGQADHPDRRIAIAVNGPLPVLAAPEAILRVVANLLDNAVKWSPSEAAVRIDAYREDTQVVVAVSDTGPGVPADDRERIFEWFTQADSGDTRPRGGIGLGLYVARQLARAHGGDLALASDHAGGVSGARFELRLPLAVGNDGDRNPPAGSVPAGDTTGNGAVPERNDTGEAAPPGEPEGRGAATKDSGSRGNGKAAAFGEPESSGAAAMPASNGAAMQNGSHGSGEAVRPGVPRP
ncbi:MAG TPA: ATP-binding protein [Actinomycetota bacterium]|nr:ATP-binding protein [Actinomycetota bacterium]